eukprot:GHVT01068458.1.p3 GENE.GHVT01068458.1~~GHVT01068458.1.p3  ORF type:complete len:131 (+),score=16.26 GHVT01068458.1:866-1258(+)
MKGGSLVRNSAILLRIFDAEIPVGASRLMSDNTEAPLLATQHANVASSSSAVVLRGGGGRRWYISGSQTSWLASHFLATPTVVQFGELSERASASLQHHHLLHHSLRINNFRQFIGRKLLHELRTRRANK